MNQFGEEKRSLQISTENASNSISAVNVTHACTQTNKDGGAGVCVGEMVRHQQEKQGERDLVGRGERNKHLDTHRDQRTQAQNYGQSTFSQTHSHKYLGWKTLWNFQLLYIITLLVPIPYQRVGFVRALCVGASPSELSQLVLVGGVCPHFGCATGPHHFTKRRVLQKFLVAHGVSEGSSRIFSSKCRAVVHKLATLQATAEADELQNGSVVMASSCLGDLIM